VVGGVLYNDNWEEEDQGILTCAVSGSERVLLEENSAARKTTSSPEEGAGQGS